MGYELIIEGMKKPDVKSMEDIVRQMRDPHGRARLYKQLTILTPNPLSDSKIQQIDLEHKQQRIVARYESLECHHSHEL